MNNRCNIVSLTGQWSARLEDNSTYVMTLPGTLDENKIGKKDVGANQWHPDSELGNATEGFDATGPITTRFTRKYTYEGSVEISKKVTYIPKEGIRTFIDVERARCLKLLIDGNEVMPYKETSISTPYVFEVTGLLKGENEVTFISDNSYPLLPHDAIVYSSAATDETQTNWNGLLGYIQLREEPECFISSVHVYPYKNNLKVVVRVDCAYETDAMVTVSSPAINESFKWQTHFIKGKNEVAFDKISCSLDIKKWDEYEGNLYDMTTELVIDEEHKDSKKVTFGIRDFGDNGKGRFALNDRTIFIRSEANCAEFPEEGHPPMDVDSWIDILNRYKDYGINYMRFHSHCPPEAAFTAADRLGMLMQPELSHWNPKDAFESDESNDYYNRELRCIVDMLANHPSFVALTLGNELKSGDKGYKRMQDCVKNAKAQDDTRLFAIASNAFYGEKGCDEESDFYASQKFFSEDIRGCFANMEGYINQQYPNTKTNYDVTMAHLRETYKKPVFSFEVGQFEVLPDFDELEKFKGISKPANYEVIKKKVEDKGLLTNWKKYVEATGEISFIGYREEVEAALRTKELSGISLLGLQDFPGQGTALVGMMNSHLEPKPFDFASPERFRSFFRDTLPLVYMEKYTYENTEVLNAIPAVANFGKKDINGNIRVLLQDRDKNKKYDEYVINDIFCPMGEIAELDVIKFDLSGINVNSKLELIVSIDDTDVINKYPVWVYTNVTPVCPASVYETRLIDENAKQILEDGGVVYLSPDATKEAIPNSIKTQFTTDFWSVGTFAGQEGGMGQLINDKHPLFKNYPTGFHTDWNWWIMASQRAIILPKQYEAIITEMDSYAYLRHMAQLIEFNCLKGKVLLSTLGLHNILQYPEVRALQQSIYDYLDSDDVNPRQSIEFEELIKMVSK